MPNGKQVPAQKMLGRQRPGFRRRSYSKLSHRKLTAAHLIHSEAKLIDKPKSKSYNYRDY